MSADGQDMTGPPGGRADQRDRRLVTFALVLTGISGVLIAGGLLFSSLRLNDYGLARSFPIPFYLGLALLPLAAAPLWFTRANVTAIIVGQLLLLLLALSLSPYIVESTARFRTAYANFGDVDWLISGAGLHPREAIYHNWPLFPALTAALVKVTGLQPTTLLAVFPFAINLAYLVPLGLLLRQFSRGDNRWWAGAWFFYLFNWTGQNYFSPQAFALLLFLTLLALLVHVSVYRDGRFTPLLVALVLAVFGAIVLTHLLTAILALTTLAVLQLTGRVRQPSLLVTALVVFLAWQSFGAFSYFEQNHQRNLGNLLDPESFILLNVRDRLQGAPGHVIVGRLRVLTTVLAFATGGAAVLAWLSDLVFRQRAKWMQSWGRAGAYPANPPVPRLLALASYHQVALAVPTLAGILVVGPIFVYGGEMLIRIMLFSLPALSLLFVVTISWRAAFVPAVVLLAVAAPVHMVTHYGNEVHDYISPGELEGFEFVATLGPANVVGAYPAARFRNSAHLDSRAAVVSGESELPTPAVYLNPDSYRWRHPDRPIYVAVGRGDGAAAYLFYNEKGFVEAGRAALAARCNFKLVFDNGELAVYRWHKTCPRGTAGVTLSGSPGGSDD